MDNETGNWRIGLTKELFLPHDAQAILSIPLSIRKPPDRMVWAFTPKGQFTVNSAYKVALSPSQASTSPLGSTSNNQQTSVFWKTLWRLKVPSKFRSFAWRACKNVLPTKSNLHSRKVLDDPTCEACGNSVETIGHALWACDKAQEVWRASGILVHSHGGSRQTSAIILQLAVNMLDEYRLANHRFTMPNVATHTTWAPPHNPWYKVNVDGAVFQQLDAVGIGVVARNHTGHCLAAMSKKLWVPLGPLEAKAKAMEEGIDFAWDIGLRDVVFETDSEVLYKSLTGSITPPATIQNIVSSCILRLQDFRAVQLTHV
ncbi:hypothetical protein SO802_028226 [Lithocarpus litseifolius]|uniref:Reverse transcriptase zinc-binding domain-containing protein n=1 Tax=Lithocarpus litseifolius TaxID=425828 RepID=A0AAW2BQA5_9ROSI